MVKHCCVQGCVNRWGLTVAGKKISFFKVPKSSGKQGNLRKHREWLKAINRENWFPHRDDVVCGMHFLTGQPSNDPKHPDYRPQILPNRIVNIQKLQEELNTWETNRDKYPPEVIEVPTAAEISKPLPILPKPKGISLALPHPLLISNQPLTVNSQQSLVTSLISSPTLIMAAQQPVTANNGTISPENVQLSDVNTNSMEVTEADQPEGTVTAGKVTESSDKSNNDQEGPPSTENAFMSNLNLKPSGDSDADDHVTSDSENQGLSNGITAEEDNLPGSPGSLASEIKIEPLDMSDSLTPPGLSAAALMSALATTAGLGKSVGTSADLPDSNMNHHSAKPGKGKRILKAGEIDEAAISKAVIKTPVKIKNAGDDEPVRFMTQYMCRYCAQRFDSMTKMQEHVAAHLKGKHTNHTCSVCGKEYRTPSKLQRHVRVHSGERPYACTVCGRRFTRSDHVKQHMKVHLPPAELNVCRLCGTRFLKRQSLQLHLQQAHLVNQLFTCNRCGEAFESLEQLNAHNLTHDVILNSMNIDGKSSDPPTLQGLAKFSVAPSLKQLEGSKLFNKIDGTRAIAPRTLPAPKPKPPAEPEVKKEPVTTEDTMKYNYVLTLDAPENQEDVTKISDRLIAESIEEESKKYEELQRQIEEQARVMAKEALKREEALQKEREQREKAESIAAENMAAAFNVERGDNYQDEESKGDNSMEVSEYESPAVLTSEDGMSMYISTGDMLKMKEGEENDISSDSEYSEMKIDDSLEEDKEHSKPVNDLDEQTDKVIKKPPNAVLAGIKKAYKPGPLWFKTAQEIHRNAALNKQSDKILNVPTVDTSTDDSSEKETQPKMISCIKPSINELLKAKVEHNSANIAESDKVINVTNTSLGLASHQPVAIAPRQVQQYILVSPPNPHAAAGQVPPQNLPKSGMHRCEHCCIWFEDRAMSLLHNTLHNADKTDPFTCRKCYKKMGNRLEFMAHLIWHLEPHMDI